MHKSFKQFLEEVKQSPLLKDVTFDAHVKYVRDNVLQPDQKLTVSGSSMYTINGIDTKERDGIDIKVTEYTKNKYRVVVHSYGDDYYTDGSTKGVFNADTAEHEFHFSFRCDCLNDVKIVLELTNKWMSDSEFYSDTNVANYLDDVSRVATIELSNTLK